MSTLCKLAVKWGKLVILTKLMFELPIPLFNVNDPLHRELAAAAARAAQVAAKVPFKEGTHFVTARKLIRTALHDHGIGQEIEELVTRLLD